LRMKKGNTEVASGKAGRIKSKATVEHHEALRPEFYQHIAELLRTARVKAYRAVNSVMVEAYWNIGHMIVEEDNRGRNELNMGIICSGNWLQGLQGSSDTAYP